MHSKILKMLTIFLLLLCACQSAAAPPQGEAADRLVLYESSFYAMDTAISLTLYAESEELAQSAARQAEREILRIDSLCSSHGENMLEPETSDVWRVNNAGGEPCPVSEEVFLLLQKSLSIAAAAQNCFGAAMGDLIGLWDIAGGGYLPTQEEIETSLARCGNAKVVLDEEALTVQLLDDAQLDLGGVAKGYAVDRVVEILKNEGIGHALVNAGGNVYALSCKPDGSPWQVGVRNPADAGEIVAVLELADCAAVTSAVDQRYFIRDGVRYHHIFDPETGYPADQCLSATVVCANSTEADLLSTALFVLGEERAAGLMEDLPPCELLIIANNSEIIVSEGMEALLYIPEQ